MSTRPRLAGSAGVRRGLLVALVVTGAGVAATGCKLPLGSPVDIRATLAPFERVPYVQAVDTSSAWILWLARSDAADRAEYRLPGEEAWRSAPVDRDTTPIFGANGELRQRSVRLEDLPAGTDVEYRVWAGEALEGPNTFRTAPVAGQADTVRVLAFGDSGWGSPGQVRLARLMESESWDLAVHTGDIAYHAGSELDYSERHFAIYRELFARVPFFPSAGNHDLIENGGAAYDRAFVWSAPSPGARYYTFRWGDVQFFSLDTATDGPDGPDVTEGAQYQWLAAELEAAHEDPTVRWIVTFFHHPLYSHAVGFSGKGPDRKLRAALLPLFDRYGVDLVLSGHDHHYERTPPIRDDEVVEVGCGPTYILTGGGGATFFARSFTKSPFLAAGARTYHYVRLEIVGDAIKVSAIDDSNQTFDEFFAFEYDGTTPEGDPLGPQCEE